MDGIFFPSLCRSKNVTVNELRIFYEEKRFIQVLF
jgi:hypothetical protein